MDAAELLLHRAPPAPGQGVVEAAGAHPEARGLQGYHRPVGGVLAGLEGGDQVLDGVGGQNG